MVWFFVVMRFPSESMRRIVGTMGASAFCMAIKSSSTLGMDRLRGRVEIAGGMFPAVPVFDSDMKEGVHQGGPCLAGPVESPCLADPEAAAATRSGLWSTRKEHLAGGGGAAHGTRALVSLCVFARSLWCKHTIAALSCKLEAWGASSTPS